MGKGQPACNLSRRAARARPSAKGSDAEPVSQPSVELRTSSRPGHTRSFQTQAADPGGPAVRQADDQVRARTKPGASSTPTRAWVALGAAAALLLSGCGRASSPPKAAAPAHTITVTHTVTATLPTPTRAVRPKTPRSQPQTAPPVAGGDGTDTSLTTYTDDGSVVELDDGSVWSADDPATVAQPSISMSRYGHLQVAAWPHARPRAA